jgi:hypothetical protein
LHSDCEKCIEVGVNLGLCCSYSTFLIFKTGWQSKNDKNKMRNLQPVCGILQTGESVEQREERRI